MFSKDEAVSEIKLVILGKDYQKIINQPFYKDSSQIFVNDDLREDCEYICQLSDDKSNITIKFNEEITSCEKMFSGIDNLIEIDLSNFDNSKVTSMNSIFQNCKQLKNINFGNINTSLVEDMSSLFEYCQALTSIDLSNFDTSSVIKMNYMFSHCSNIKSIDASSFNTAKLEEMEYLFSFNIQMIIVDLSSFDTSNVKTIEGMFYHCESLKYLNLENFNISSNLFFSHIFGFCNKLVYLNLRNFNISRNILINENTFEETFKNIPMVTKYCIEDLYTKNQLINDKLSACSNLCFEENIKFDIEENICKQSCSEQDYEIKNNCYNKNPDHTKSFYKDKDNIYKECFNLCQSCSKSGNKTNHNCDKCKNGFLFLNDSEALPQNCYKKCDHYYYFDESNHYYCSEINECPPKYNILIEQKKKCIKD